MAIMHPPIEGIEDRQEERRPVSARSEPAVFVATEQRFVAWRGGVYAVGAGDYSFWRRYLTVFPRVNVVARVTPVEDLPAGSTRADGPQVHLVPLPTYLGPRQALGRLPGLLAAVGRLTAEPGAWLLRVPGLVGTLVYLGLRIRRRPFAVEVVGDPQESLSRAALGHLGAALYRPLAGMLLRRQCRHAAGAAYVTAETLQRRYPPGGEMSTHYSSVELTDDWFEGRDEPRGTRTRIQERIGPARLIFVGSLAQRYKGLHVLLGAIRLCREEGFELRLEVVGDGKLRPEYEGLVERWGLRDAVHFAGTLPPGAPVREQLRAADLLVMPSLVEGLPRAMLEAMACGLPCIGSRVGGIPELLDPDEMVPAKDPRALARKIGEMVSNPARMAAAGGKNRSIARGYRASVLEVRRNAFYRHLSERTQVES
jgi:glycosyltransferase involved in cell wall biosynthesis